MDQYATRRDLGFLAGAGAAPAASRETPRRHDGKHSAVAPSARVSGLDREATLFEITKDVPIKNLPQTFQIGRITVRIETAGAEKLRISLLEKTYLIQTGKQVTFTSDKHRSQGGIVGLAGLPENFLLIICPKTGKIELKAQQDIISLGETDRDAGGAGGAGAGARVPAGAGRAGASEVRGGSGLFGAARGEGPGSVRHALASRAGAISPTTQKITQLNRHLLVAESEVSRLMSEFETLGIEAKILEEHLKEVLARREALNSGIEQKREEVDLLKVKQQEILRSSRGDAHLGDDSTHRVLGVGDSGRLDGGGAGGAGGAGGRLDGGSGDSD